MSTVDGRITPSTFHPLSVLWCLRLPLTQVSHEPPRHSGKASPRHRPRRVHPYSPFPRTCARQPHRESPPPLAGERQIVRQGAAHRPRVPQPRPRLDRVQRPSSSSERPRRPRNTYSSRKNLKRRRCPPRPSPRARPRLPHPPRVRVQLLLLLRGKKSRSRRRPWWRRTDGRMIGRMPRR